MKKMNNKGFMLAETLIVTTFVAGVLIFMFMQFTSVSGSYEDSYKYNIVEDLYALEDIKNYILSDSGALELIDRSINPDRVMYITNCSIFTNQDYCKKLFNIEGIDQIIVSNNYFDSSNISIDNEEFSAFIKKIKGSGNQKYRLIASFKNDTYATIRFGE